MSVRRSYSAVTAVAVWSVCIACSESKTAPEVARLEGRRAAVAAPAVELHADVSLRVAPVGKAAAREVRYHIARTKRSGTWRTTLTMPPMSNGMSDAHRVARIEIAETGAMQAYARDGRALDFNAPVPQLSAVSHPVLAQFDDIRKRSGTSSKVTPRSRGIESLLLDARQADEARRALVARYGAPQSGNGREVFTAEAGDTRSAYHFDPTIGAVVEAHVRKNDGTSVDLTIRYDQVRPGLFVRGRVSTVFSAPGMSAMKSELTLSNVRVEGQP